MDFEQCVLLNCDFLTIQQKFSPEQAVHQGKMNAISIR